MGSPPIDQLSRPFFASESSGSVERMAAEAHGLVKPGESYYQLQKNDEMNLFASDDEAIEFALDEEDRGDRYAVEQLALAKTDLAVWTARQVRARNPNRCTTCDHRRHRDGGHCYMFRDMPTEICMQHTGRRLGAFEIIRRLIREG